MGSRLVSGRLYDDAARRRSVTVMPDTHVHPETDVRADALVELGELLRDAGYAFVTVTPETHRRVLARSTARARSLRDVFGWNRVFDASLLGSDMHEALSEVFGDNA